MVSANFFQFLLLFFRLRSPATGGSRQRMQRILAVIRRIRASVFLMFASLGVGTLGYVVIEDYPWFDAYYMAVITLASVGFGEVHPLGFGGRLFTSFLILFNIGLFAYAISTITNVFAEGGFTKLLNDFRMNGTIERLSGHTIVCGFGRHATEVAQELSKQRIPFVVVEKKSDKIEYLRTHTNYLFVEGDATEDEILEEAGIRRAASLITTLPDDADNLFVTLSARQISPALRIISRANNEADEVKIRRAGASQTVVPERIGGFYMATLVNKPDLVEFFTLISNMGPSNVVFEEVEVSDLLPQFRGKTIEQCGLFKQTRVALVAIRYPNGQYELNPPLTTILLPDWHIVVLGNPDQVADFRINAVKGGRV
jgi:voltage-gated potassium channel